MLASLLRASIGGAVGVALVWVVCRLVPPLSASMRAMLWWCVAAKFLIALVWLAPVRLPLLPAPVSTSQVVAPARVRLQRVRMDLPNERLALREVTARVTMAPSGSPDQTPFIRRMLARVSAITPWLDPSRSHSLGDQILTWLGSRTSMRLNGWVTRWRRSADVFLAVWLLGVLLATGIGLRHWRRASALVARSTVAAGNIRALIADLATRMSLSRLPDVRVSNEIETPLVIGLRRPVVLVPDDAFARLSERQQEMALCHELAHIKRYDLPLGSLPALTEALFFFHPFAKLAAREYALSREAACDAAVLRALDAPPHEYGRLLLDLGVATPRMGLSVAGMSPASAYLKRRLTMLDDQTVSVRTPRWLMAAAVCAMVVAMAPVRLVARRSTTALSVPSTNSQEGLPPTSLTQRGPWGFPRFDYVMFRDDGRVIAGWEPPATVGLSRRPHLIVGVALFQLSGTAPGAVADVVAHARQFRRAGEPMLWFRRDGHEYVVRDAATLRYVETLWSSPRALAVAPARELTEAARISVQHDLDTRMREIQMAIGALISEIQRDKQVSDLDDQISKLGQQMETLGRDIQQAGIVDTQTLMDRAIAKGLARVDPGQVLQGE